MPTSYSRKLSFKKIVLTQSLSELRYLWNDLGFSEIRLIVCVNNDMLTIHPVCALYIMHLFVKYSKQSSLQKREISIAGIKHRAQSCFPCVEQTVISHNETSFFYFIIFLLNILTQLFVYPLLLLTYMCRFIYRCNKITQNWKYIINHTQNTVVVQNLNPRTTI